MKQSKNHDKPLFKRWQTYVYGTGALCLLGLILPEPPQEKSEPVAQVAEQEITPPIEAPVVESAPVAEVKADVATPKPEPKPQHKPPTITLASVINDTLGADYTSHTNQNGVLTITAKLADNLTVDWIVKGAHDKVATLSEQLVADKLLDGVDAVQYVFTTELVDTYGNTSEDAVLSVKLSADTLSKINFDNFRADNLPTVADDYFRHGALQ